MQDFSTAAASFSTHQFTTQTLQYVTTIKASDAVFDFFEVTRPFQSTFQTFTDSWFVPLWSRETFGPLPWPRRLMLLCRPYVCAIIETIFFGADVEKIRHDVGQCDRLLSPITYLLSYQQATQVSSRKASGDTWS